MTDITETEQPLAWLAFRPDFPETGREEWDNVLICDGHGDPGRPFDQEQLVDLKTVSGILGHFSAGFTLDAYAHVTTAAQKGAAQTIGNVLSI